MGKVSKRSWKQAEGWCEQVNTSVPGNGVKWRKIDGALTCGDQHLTHPGSVGQSPPPRFQRRWVQRGNASKRGWKQAEGLMCEPAPRLRNDLPPSQTRTSSQRRRMIKFGADGKTPPAHVSSSFLPFASLMCSFDAKTRCGTTAIRLLKKQWLFLFRFWTNLSIVSRNKACL